MIRASDFRFVQDGTSREYSCKIDGGPFPERLFFSGQTSTKPEFAAPSANFALVGLLYPAMALGEDLLIDAPVSPLLLHTIQNDIQSLLIHYHPKLKRVKVSATSAATALDMVTSGVATGFSAGVDTFTTLALFTGDDVPDRRRLTSLAVFDVGAMGPFDKTAEIFDKYGERVREYAEANNFTWQTARSNLDQFYRAVGAGFQKTHVIRNAAAALLFEDLHSHYLYSSALPYWNINTGHNDMAYIEPILLPLLSTETMQLSSAGAGLARTQKTKLVSTYQPAMGMLDVCVSSAANRMKSQKINCSMCWKCARTMLTLDVLGKLDDFAAVFDREEYQANKDQMILTVHENALNGGPVDLDLIALMEKKHFDFKVSKSALMKQKRRVLISRVKSRLSGVPGLKSFYRTVRRRK